MNVTALLLVGLGGSFAVCWLIHYIPLSKTLFGRLYSPRLMICRTLGPLDAVITLILVGGGWVGLTAITGIGMMIYNVTTGIGLSLGIIFTKKVLKPRWEKQYKQILSNRKNILITTQKGIEQI